MKREIIQISLEQFKKFNLTPFDLLFNTMLVYVKGLCTRKGLEECNEHSKTLKPFGKPGNVSGKLTVNPVNLHCDNGSITLSKR